MKRPVSFLGSQPIRIMAILLIAIFFVIGVGTTSSAGSFSTELSQLAWFYKPPSDGNLDTLAKNYDNYLLTHGDERTREALKAKGVSAPFFMYLRFDAIDPASCSERPRRNQAAYQTGDYCDIARNHSDWFLLDKYGRKITVDGYYVMDPGNSGWRSFFLRRAKAAVENYGWDGLFMDNTDASFGRFRRLGRYPRRYSSEGAYTSAVKGMLSYIRSNLGRPLYANITHVRDSSVWFDYMEHLTGGMAEGIIVGWHSDWRSVSDWEENVKRIERTQSMGRRMIIVAQGDKSNTRRQAFSYASYLLAANGKAAFRYGLANHYRYAWLYNNYNYNLGTPLGPRYYSNGWWKRDFSRGKVSVNPSSHEARISTGSSSSGGAYSDGDNTTSKIYVKKEAESGTLYSPMRKTSSSSASGGYYIYVPNGSGNDRGKAVYSISVSSSGTYYFWGRVNAPNSYANSFGVVIDGVKSFGWSFSASSSWTWRKLSSSFYLSSGTHRLEIRGDEDGTQLDRLVVTNDSNYQP